VIAHRLGEEGMPHRHCATLPRFVVDEPLIQRVRCRTEPPPRTSASRGPSSRPPRSPSSPAVDSLAAPVPATRDVAGRKPEKKSPPSARAAIAKSKHRPRCEPSKEQAAALALSSITVKQQTLPSCAVTHVGYGDEAGAGSGARAETETDVL
jgi:hypothetical protein